MLGSLGGLRLQFVKGEFVTPDPFQRISLRIDRRKHPGRIAAALDDKGAGRAEPIITALFSDIARRADPAADRLVEALKARGGIQHIAERGVLQPLAGADIADEGKAAVHADAGMAEFDAARMLLGAKFFAENLDVERRRDGPVSMIWLMQG